VLVEIGSGMGEATAEMAISAPELNYVAVEVYKPGHGQLLLHAERLEPANLRLLRGDATILLEQHVPPDSLAGVRLFFPDPWPKTRHHKRRLVRPEIVRLIADRLAPGATLHMATDWANYAEQMLRVCSAQPMLRNRYPDWAPRPDWRPVTKFERRARDEGRISRDLVFERR
jgi:tRNA (guanine-N7-)-methyltransferase